MIPERSQSPYRVSSIVLLVLALLGCAAAGAPSRYGLAEDAYNVFTRWQDGTCIGEEERTLREALLRYKAPLSIAFEKAFTDGPPAEELRAARVAAEARYADRARFPLDAARIEGVSRQDLARFREVSGEAYVNDQVQRFATGYRANAAAGLAIVGGAEARALLARTATNKEDPLASAAAQALKSMRPD